MEADHRGASEFLFRWRLAGLPGEFRRRPGGLVDRLARVVTKTDLVLPGRLPVTLTRTYQTNGAVTGPFGRGTTHTTQVVLLVEANRRSLQFGDGRRVTLTQQPDGSYRNLTDGLMQGAVLTSPGGVPTVQWKDGSKWVFGVTLSGGFGVTNLGLTQQIDRNGNTLTNTWSGSRITAITGPDGRQLLLDYDGSNRVTRVTDPIGRTVQYAYDGQGNLATATDPEGGTTRYEYDSQNRMTRITDPKNITYLQNFYGPSGRVLRQIQANSSEYRFRYQLSGATRSGAGCTVTNPPNGGATTITLPFVPVPRWIPGRISKRGIASPAAQCWRQRSSIHGEISPSRALIPGAIRSAALMR